MRQKIFATLVVALALSAGLFVVGVGAQRGRAAQPANDNASRGSDQPKRVFVGRGSDSAKGSRVTIKSDNPLNDYSAYRSGDRFYVVLPRSAAGSVTRGGGGKGYSDMQVQQRGDSVVLSYRVQPGAKPRVEQKFNRLDVVFDVAEDNQQNTAANQGSAAHPSPSPAEGNRNPATTAQQQQSNQTPPASSTADTGTTGERRPPASASSNAGTQGTSAPPVNTNPSTVATAPPPAAAEQGAHNGTTPATEQTQEIAPSTTPTVEQQIAQAQPPTTIAPITTTNPARNPATNTQAGSTLGTFLIRNWWALALVLALVGLGLIFAARRASPPVEDEVSERKGAAPLDEPRTARLKDASTAATAAAKLDTVEASRVDAVPFVAASALAADTAVRKTRKETRKEARRKGKKKGARTEELPLDERPAVEDSLVTEPAVADASAVAESAVEEPSVADVAVPSVAESVISEPFVEEPAVAVEESAVAFAEPASKEHAKEVTAVEEETADGGLTAVEELTVGEGAAVVTSTSVEAVEPSDEPEELTLGAPNVASVETEAVETGTAQTVAPVAEIVPALAPDPDRVQAETGRLLEGASYDRAVLSSRDSMARQMIATELLSALSGRNAERRERARGAFVEQGFFDETARDLREATAPAERSAAARSLAIFGDHAATPHLIAALEDDSIDVRRAAVEALGALRDPAAVVPLETLLEREKNQKNRIPIRVIRNAVESSREAAAEARTETLASAAAVVEPESVETVVAPESVAPVVARESVVEPKAIEVEPSDIAATAEVAPLEEITLSTEATSPAAPVEVTLSESGDETAVVLTPFPDEPAAEVAQTPEVSYIPEVKHAPEQSLVEDASADEEVTLVAEAETLVVGEASASAAETQPVVEEVFAPEELQAITEAPVLESAVAEPHAVLETGIQPTIEAATWEISPEVGIQPFEEPTDEVVAPESSKSVAPAAEPERAALFDASADEVTREIEPAPAVLSDEAATSFSKVAPDGWFEFDMSELPAGTRPGAVEQFAGEQAASSAAFESSADESFTTPTEAAHTLIEEPTPVSSVHTEAESGVELARTVEAVTAPLAEVREKGVTPFDESSTVPASIQQRLASPEPTERAAAIVELSHVDTGEAFHQICGAFDDEAKEVRSAAARALYELRADRAESFTRALREATPERRRQIGASISTSGLAGEAISQLTGESREKTYEAFSLLFLMAKAGEVQPLVRAIEGHPNNEVRLAVVKLLALSGQKEILPAFRRLAVRGSLPTEVRSAVMEAIYQISSSQPSAA
jgi:HEAT repeat protein